MAFSDLLQYGNTVAARTFASVSTATVSAWFPPEATDSPGTRAGFTVAVSDVAQGPPRITRDTLSGTVLTPSGAIRISLKTAALSYQPKANETVLLVGASRAMAMVYRVSVVEIAGGVMELECKEEAQWLA